VRKNIPAHCCGWLISLRCFGKYVNRLDTFTAPVVKDRILFYSIRLLSST
jgi:hypothetical protein